jgi:hypothetical protein
MLTSRCEWGCVWRLQLAGSECGYYKVVCTLYSLRKYPLSKSIYPRNTTATSTLSRKQKKYSHSRNTENLLFPTFHETIENSQYTSKKLHIIYNISINTSALNRQQMVLYFSRFCNECRCNIQFHVSHCLQGEIFVAAVHQHTLLRLI